MNKLWAFLNAKYARIQHRRMIRAFSHFTIYEADVPETPTIVIDEASDFLRSAK